VGRLLLLLLLLLKLVARAALLLLGLQGDCGHSWLSLQLGLKLLRRLL
jgi:hypothetical protein